MVYARDKERLRRVAERQYGRVTGAQLAHLGLWRSTIKSWIETGYLVPVLPKVYAVGHSAPGREADLWAAVLYAGPGAMLSHGTAAQWRGLIKHAPPVIEVSTPRKIKSAGGVKVYCRRDHDRYFEKDLPVTSIPQTLVDLAATSNLKLVRRALAQLDYRGQLNLQDLEALEAICCNGRPGSKLLRKALKIHQPELAHTNGTFEANFLEWCERWKVPIPSFNAYLHGILVDALWPAANLVVELDGGDNHSSRAQLHRDRENDLTLRRRGVTVHRYVWEQLREQGPGSRRDPRGAQLAAQRGSASRLLNACRNSPLSRATTSAAVSSSAS